ncbi:aldehyde dehydrogenase (NADP(+)) [Pseudochryseolinea flava]|uniref:Aldehyde dehydrogenase (NADP(+)) n=1 Tax=Pseudochryseolinea flava TaxID=2059302 RepID=A0A364Y654_9BACT|nr:aldehyde dehydrogenase (NADP(+)) [Pseudochryseolinea flava]RAW02285.1 aldehyde dehydrogenase (NADP(+)) [Pseudochryseolinea flava]
MKLNSIDQVLQNAAQAFEIYKRVDAKVRSKILRTIADEIDATADALVVTATQESNLQEARIKGEIGRTTGQLRSFANLLDDGQWVQATIDVGDENRKPLPKPDLRKMNFPIGPIVVFGASNFPLAFSTAGGDTASALAAGCTVIVKSHPAHPRTSILVANAIAKSIATTNMPTNVFQHIEDSSIEVGQQLVAHPLTKGVAFTGSFQGGKSLFDLAAKRKEPIPVFAEMGSINPVVVLPSAVKENKLLPETLAASVLQGVGQFCTNPGLLITVACEGIDDFVATLASTIAKSTPAKMLHSGIASHYHKGKSHLLAQAGVTTLATVEEVDIETTGAPALAVVSADHFIQNPTLSEEVFGPFSLVVKCANATEVLQVIQSLPGQLTASLFGSSLDVESHHALVDALHQRCGRLIFNGVPTGVEVCKAMHHGGPFPATTDARFTSVGNDAIYRFVRPISFQNAPAAILPAELKDENPLNILRCVNNQWTTEKIVITKG